MTERVGAYDLIAKVVDPGSWSSWDVEPEQPTGISADYRHELAEARRRSGTDESLVTGQASISGRDVAVVVGEFGFLAGSIGHAATHRLVRAIELARAYGLPLFAAPTSGGTRMQEGTPAFVGMIRITAALTQYKEAGLPYIVYLRHPTTGGVFASWGSLGHFTVAEPGALIGFLGPRVFQALHGEAFPAGVQTSENLFQRGLIDAVLGLEDLAPVASRALDVLMAPRRPPIELEDVRDTEVVGRPAWDSILRTRRRGRVGVRSLLRSTGAPVVPLWGTGEGESDGSMLVALTMFGAMPCLVAGQDRRHQASVRRLGPAGLRVARRGMRLAEELRLPFVSVIDTSGVELSKESEEGAVAGEIARCLAKMVTLKTASVCLMLGEGTGGGALALLPADRVISAEHSWLSPLPPEGAAAILHRDVGRAPDVAAAQRVRAVDLRAIGVVDRIVHEDDEDADGRGSFLARVTTTLEYELSRLGDVAPDQRMKERLERYGQVG